MMEKARPNPVIKLCALQKLQSLFQKDRGELIDIYLEEAERKIAHLYQALENNNIARLALCAQELRHRSADMGAIQFSHSCLSIEIAAQEHRLESIKKQLALLENQFTIVKQSLESLKATA